MTEQETQQEFNADKFFDALKEDLSEEEQEFFDVIETGGQIKDLKGLTDEDVDAFYGIGHNLYQQKKYDEAETMFRYVCMMTHLNRDYWLALANCQMMGKKFEDAINTYGFAYTLDLDDPWPCIYTAQCYMGLEDKENAGAALDLADKTIELAEGDFADAADRIKGLRGGLN